MGKELKREFRKGLDGLVSGLWMNVEQGIKNPFYETLKTAVRTLSEHGYDLTKYHVELIKYIRKTK